MAEFDASLAKREAQLTEGLAEIATQLSQVQEGLRTDSHGAEDTPVAPASQPDIA